MAFVYTLPTTATSILDIPELHSTNWYAFAELLEIDHYGFTSVVSGRHYPGQTSIICAGASANVEALTPPACGAIGFDNTSGQFMGYLDGSWKWIAQFPQCRVKCYKASDSSVAAAGETLTFSEEFDTLNSFSSTKFTAPSSGYYSANIKVTVLPPVGGISISLILYHCNSSGGVKNSIPQSTTVGDDNRITLRMNHVIQMTTSDYIYVYIAHNYSGNIVVEGNSSDPKITTFSIKRLS